MPTAVVGHLANGSPYTLAQLLSLAKTDQYTFLWNGPAAFIATLSGAILLALVGLSVTLVILKLKARGRRRAVPGKTLEEA
jgi:hypothetical protein